MKLKKIEIIGIILLIFGIIYIIKIKIDESNNMDLMLETNTNEIIASSNNEEKTMIKVHIDGQIKNRGVVELEEGSRLVDAIEKSGGLTEEADTSNINLADILQDGEKVYIYSKQEVEELKSIGKLNEEIDNTTKKDNKININTATQAELEEITGIGPSLAQKIIEYRESNGKFKDIEELKNVSGIGDKKFESMKSQITI